MSEFFGITPEAIRKYEGKGIVQVRRDENNKYRKYTTWEVFSMLHARRFSRIGFTLGQASELLKTSDTDVFFANINELQEKLAEEIAWKRKLIILLDQKKKERNDIARQGKQIQIEYLDELLFFKIAHNFCLNTETDIQTRKKWIEALPFVSEYVVCGTKNPSESMTTGFAIRKKDTEIYGLEHLKPTRIIPAGFYVTCILKGDYDELIMEKQIGEVLGRIKEKHYRLGDEVYAEIFDYAKVEGKYEALHKCFFPVEI